MAKEKLVPIDEQERAEDAVVRQALNSIWNSYGGDEVMDDVHGSVCRVAACGLDQTLITCIDTWDEDGAFARSHWVKGRDGELARAEAIITALRRVVHQGLQDGILREVPNSTRYSLGVTFVRGKEL